MIIGVGFLLFAPINGGWKLFVLKELKEKPAYHKSAGMLSFPLETFEFKDICPRNTIPRLIEEEMGVDPREVNVAGFSRKRFTLIPGRNDITTFYGWGIYTGDCFQSFDPKDDDIEFVGWMTPRELLRNLIRVEVVPIISDFMNNFQHLLNEHK